MNASASQPPTRRIIVLAGPSGSGKGRLGKRSTLPVLNLDDFYRDLDEPGLPRRFGIVDWDDPASWNRQSALSALEELCRSGRVSIPTYSISASRRTGEQVFDATSFPLVIAEGIFASTLVKDLAERGLLADALVLDRPAPLVFALRLARDVREGRKALGTLLVRGFSLARSQRRDIEQWASHGMRRTSLTSATRIIARRVACAEVETRRRTSVPPRRAQAAGEITVSAVCLNAVVRTPERPDGAWATLGVRKRGTTMFMQSGGKPEPGESALECAVREVSEELGLELDPALLTEVGRFETPAANEPGMLLKSTVFLAPPLEEPHAIAPRAEIEEVRWFPIEDEAGPEVAPLFRDEVLPHLRSALTREGTLDR